jgi:hypothetical protein
VTLGISEEPFFRAKSKKYLLLTVDEKSDIEKLLKTIGKT